MKRDGLAGDQSWLFKEQIRVTKEMRDSDKQRGRTGKDIRPRHFVWENVCFAADTLVTCENGYKRIADICVGDRVKTLSGRYHTVAEVHKTQNQSVIDLKISGGENLVVTPNHPFYVREKIYLSRNSYKRIVSEPKWLRADELTKNHLVGYRIDIPDLPTDFVSNAEAWILGRWLADGSVDLTKTNPRIFVSCGLTKADFTRRKLSELDLFVGESMPHETAVNFTFTSARFYSLIASAGRGAENKRVPSFVFRLPFSLQREVLDGYLSGDGHKRQRGKNVEIAAGTVSRELSYGICRLIRNVYRVSANISVRQPKDGLINGRILHANYPVYTVYASLTNSATTAFVDSEFVWQPVKSISQIGSTETVYNLSVLEDNTYAANDVTVHNCGALSSPGKNDKGKDFQAVLSEIVRIAQPKAPDVPMPEGGVWPSAGILYPDVGDWSIAWRVHDAQFWGKSIVDDGGNLVKAGTPQRRRRIAVVADFGGMSAGEILFERESLSGDSEPSGKEEQTYSGVVEDCTDETVGVDIYNQSLTGFVSKTLNSAATDSDHVPCVIEQFVFENHSQDSRYRPMGEVNETVSAKYGTGGNNQPLVVTIQGA